MLHAIDNRDPASGAPVLSRGLFGTRRDAVTVTSPMFKSVFDAATGSCLNHTGVAVTVHQARRAGQLVEVRWNGWT